MEVNILNKKILTIFSILLISTFLIPTIQAQEPTPPQVRYVAVESITLETIYIEGPEPVDTNHFVYTFALFKVNEGADRCYFKTWIIRKKQPFLLAHWGVGFSANIPPGLQGIYPIYTTGLLQIHTIMAEFPYKSEVIVHPEDGEQTYYFYRMHFYFTADTFSKGDKVRLTADYMNEPTFEGKEIVVVKLQRLIETADMSVFRLKEVRPKKTK